MKRLKQQFKLGLLLMAVLGSAKAIDLSTRMEFVEIRSTQNANKIIALESNLDTLRNASASKFSTLEGSLAALKTQVANIPTPKDFPRHKIGELYQGGLVFQVDEAGQHGLLVALKDATDEGLAWRNGASGNKTTNARADGLYAGDTNTRLIVAAQTPDQQKGQFAALAALTYQVAGDGLSPCNEQSPACYGNWYLPSAYELTLLYQTLVATGLIVLPADSYWSSTELSVGTARLFAVSEGGLKPASKVTTAHIRPISRF